MRVKGLDGAGKKETAERARLVNACKSVCDVREDPPARNRLEAWMGSTLADVDPNPRGRTKNIHFFLFRGIARP